MNAHTIVCLALAAARQVGHAEQAQHTPPDAASLRSNEAAEHPVPEAAGGGSEPPAASAGQVVHCCWPPVWLSCLSRPITCPWTLNPEVWNAQKVSCATLPALLLSSPFVKFGSRACQVGKSLAVATLNPTLQV